MPLGFSDLLVVQTLRTEMTYVLVGRREDMLIMTVEPLRKCIINYTNNFEPCPPKEGATLELNASVTEHLCPRNKGDGGKKNHPHFNEKVQQSITFPHASQENDCTDSEKSKVIAESLRHSWLKEKKI